MKFIVHAGMHKTGSTSIQQAFYHAAGNDYAYLDLGNPNCSTPLYLMFEEPERFGRNVIVAANGQDQSENLAVRERLLHAAKEQITTCPHDRILISGEDISGFNHRLVKNLAIFLRQYSDDIEVITYVRPPGGYMESGFQERLKRSFVDMSADALWPKYQLRFGNLIDVFGWDPLQFIPFYPSELANGDVITDFSMRSGLPCPMGPQLSYNESLSTEAISLLYHYRKHIFPDAQTSPDGFAAEQRFVNQLAKIGTTKLRFSTDFLNRARHKFREDWEFAKELTGKPLREARENSDMAITNAGDLERVAAGLLPQIKELVLEKGGRARGDLSDCLRELHGLEETELQLPANLQIRTAIRRASLKLRRVGFGSMIDRLQARI